jgi:tungstate transport system ATP-binding protein
MPAFLDIQNLHVIRDRRLVLELDTLALEKGEIIALTGPNGAGKSTLLLVLAGLIRSQNGQIFRNGQAVDPFRDREYRRRIGLVMQEPLLLDMPVYDNVAIGLRFRNVPGAERRQRVGEWLERLNILHLMKRPASKLSGGEAQRVALARAFVLQPELLLLDEPFSSLDKKTRADLIRDLRNLLPETKATTLFSTHDDREVALLAQQRIELVDGKCVSSSEVFSNQASDNDQGCQDS